jgi:hypothetical protein
LTPNIIGNKYSPTNNPVNYLTNDDYPGVTRLFGVVSGGTSGTAFVDYHKDPFGRDLTHVGCDWSGGWVCDTRASLGLTSATNWDAWSSISNDAREHLSFGVLRQPRKAGDVMLDMSATFFGVFFLAV